MNLSPAIEMHSIRYPSPFGLRAGSSLFTVSGCVASCFDAGGVDRDDADGARDSSRRNVEMHIGSRRHGCAVLKRTMVRGPEDMGKCVNFGEKRTLLRNEFRAPASPIASFRIKALISVIGPTFSVHRNAPSPRPSPPMGERVPEGRVSGTDAPNRFVPLNFVHRAIELLEKNLGAVLLSS